VGLVSNRSSEGERGGTFKTGIAGANSFGSNRYANLAHIRRYSKKFFRLHTVGSAVWPQHGRGTAPARARDTPIAG